MVWPPYWVVQRLIATITATPTWTRFHGELALAGIDPMMWPIHVFCDAAYAWLTKGSDRKDLARFDAELMMPPIGTELGSLPQWSEDSLASGFDAAYAAFRS